jgi:hypothetical protein
MRAIFFALALAACTTSPADDAAKPEVDAGGPTPTTPDARAADAVADVALVDAVPDVAQEGVADAAPILRDAVWDGPPWSCTKLTKPPACPAPAPSYADVTPFFKQYCVGCHTAADNENMTTYEGVTWQKTNVTLDLLGCTMPNVPPWPTMDERQKVLEWLACDAPQ